MKTIRSLFLSLILALGLHSAVLSQFATTELLMGGVKDAEKLFGAYLKPYANMFGANLNAGWYNTGRVHKLGGFDITITVNASWAPPSDLLFKPGNLGLSSDASITNGTESPTAAGKQMSNRPLLTYSKNAPAPLTGKIQLASFTLPNGSGINAFPAPMAQLGIGLVKGTDVTLRYFPSINLGGEGNVGLWGVGLKHSISQWIPAVSRLPILDITAQGGYTKLTLGSSLHYGPAKINVPGQTNNQPIDYVNDPNKWTGQKLEFIATAWTANIIISETIPIISFYQAIGYCASNVNLGLVGNFPFPSVETNSASPNFGKIVVNNVVGQGIVKDPINVDMQNNKNVRLNAGFRLKLGVLTIHGDFTKANYSVGTVGLGISFR